MYKLLKAGIYKLIKSKIFWGMIATVILIAGIRLGIELPKDEYSKDRLENILFENIYITAFAIAIFISLFTGVEYSERNN